MNVNTDVPRVVSPPWRATTYQDSRQVQAIMTIDTRDEDQERLLQLLQTNIQMYFEETSTPPQLSETDCAGRIPSPKLMALIGFVGEHIQGNLQLICCQYDVPHLYPMIRECISDDFSRDELLAIYADALGELSNQLLGRFKNNLIEQGVTLQMGIPSLVKSHHIQALSTPSLPTLHHTFYLIQGEIVMQVCVSMLIAEEFSMTTSDYNQTEDEPMLQPGEMLIF